MDMTTLNFQHKGDGTGRPIRDVQKDILSWLEEVLPSTHRIKAICAPTGVGKSYIARAVQLGTDAHYLAPSNLLIDQVIDTYPDVNFVKGKTHYECEASGLRCSDYFEGPGDSKRYCSGSCSYKVQKTKAVLGEPSFFNPMSYYYATLSEDFKPPRVLIVDEAHQLISMASLLAGKKFSKSKYDFDKRCENEIYLVEWLDTQIGKLRRLLGQYTGMRKRRIDEMQSSANNPERTKSIKAALNGVNKHIGEISQELERVKLVSDSVRENPQNYSVTIEKTYGRRPDTYLNVKPIKPPRHIINRLLTAEKVILMSATLLPPDLRDLAGREDYDYFESVNPIPKENRKIFYRPMPFKLNYKTPPELVVAQIEDIITKHGDKNILIHTTYSQSKKLAPHFTHDIIVNDAKNKDEKLEEFKKKGGIFLASGCAEGIDLPGDLCRINIIPKLAYPDMGDDVVKKRMKLADGDEWYNLEALKLLIQQAGRSTRGPDDWSYTYVLDPGFAWRVSKYKNLLPKSFIESIVWSK